MLNKHIKNINFPRIIVQKKSDKPDTFLIIF